jgi:hypothetical protein
MDKTPLGSKKFIAFFFSLVVLAGILIIALYTQTFGWPMVVFMSIGILGVCTLAIGYILPQAALDKFMQTVSKLKEGNNDKSDNTLE